MVAQKGNFTKKNVSHLSSFATRKEIEQARKTSDAANSSVLSFIDRCKQNNIAPTKNFFDLDLTKYGSSYVNDKLKLEFVHSPSTYICPLYSQGLSMRDFCHK